MIALQLFWSFFQIGLFSIGGGYAAMPMIESQVVELHGWLSMGEFIDVVTISQMTPGPIAINAASFVGMRIASIPGAIVATLGCCAPSCIIVLTLAYFYFKYQNLSVIQGTLAGLRPAVVSLIAASGLSIMLIAFFGGKAADWFSVHWNQLDLVACGLFALGLFVLRKFQLNPITVMLGCGVLGLLLYGVLPLVGVPVG